MDAAEAIRESRLIIDRDAESSPFLGVVFSVLVRLLVASYSSYAFLLFYWRQLVYSIQRYFVYNSRTPQRIRQDVAHLPKIPQHVAFILELSSQSGIEGLVHQAIECSGWCLGVGNDQVTLYERTGALQQMSPQSLADVISMGLARHFEYDSVPLITVRCGKEVVTAGSVSSSVDSDAINTAISVNSSSVDEDSASSTDSADTADGVNSSLEITLASEKDGRPMLVSMAQGYAAEIHKGELHQHEITVEKVHKDLQERVGDEPDLLVTFGSKLDMAGFSPWLLRVTELFCLPDNNNVFHYMVFSVALHKFANVKVNLGA